MENDLLKHGDGTGRPTRRFGIKSFARALIALALCFAVVLLVSSLRGVPEQTHAYLSSLPLALAGVGYALLQTALRPGRGTLLKRLLLAATFMGWAINQLLPAGSVAVFLGDVVVAVYVLDLYWIAQEQTSIEATSADTVAQEGAAQGRLLGNGACSCGCFPANRRFHPSA